jgi:hypothetical protein
MAHLRRPLLVLATLCPPFEYLDDPLRKFLVRSGLIHGIGKLDDLWLLVLDEAHRSIKLHALVADKSERHHFFQGIFYRRLAT